MVILTLTHSQAVDLLSVVESSDLDLTDIEQELIDALYKEAHNE